MESASRVLKTVRRTIFASLTFGTSFSIPFNTQYILLSTKIKLNSLLVGSNGIEPSTSRLSGVRSNHLSYEPIY